MVDFRDAIPAVVTERIQHQIRIAVKNTEKSYPFQKSSEDSVTGSLGGQLMNEVSGQLVVDGEEYIWDTKSFTIRGIGRNAPEKKIGADGIIEVSISDARTGRKIASKGLPFQAKKEGNSSGLLDQMKNLRKISCSSIVIDYTENGFDAIREDDIIQADGEIRDVAENKVEKLSDILTDDFFNCTIGRQNISYDMSSERIVDRSDPTQPLYLTFQPKSVTKISVRQRKGHGFTKFIR